MYLTEGQTQYLDEEVKRAFAALAKEYADVSARLFADDPNLGVDPLDYDQ